MAYSRATLVQQVRHVLQDTPAADSITGAYSAAGLTLSVADATLYDKGDIIEFLSDNGAGTGIGDTFLVDSASGTTITMIAAGLGWDGSTNVAHDSGDIFLVRPAFRYIAILEAIEATILDLWPWAWKAVTDTVTPVSGTKWYDAATSTTLGMDIIDAVQRDTSTPAGIVDYGQWRTAYRIEHRRSLPTAVASSTVGYYIPVFNNTTYTIAVRVRAKLTAAFSTPNYSDLTAGLMTDTIVYGAAARLFENTEVPRVTQQDVTMGDASVVPQARLRGASYFYRRFLEMRQMLKMELEVTIPRQAPGVAVARKW